MDSLTRADTLVIFTTSPTGLGHIRVMDALREGLPQSVKSVQIGLENVKANKIHSLGSRIPILTKITEFYQTYKLPEILFNFVYTFFLKFNKKEAYQELSRVKDEFPGRKNWVIVATHFGLAHTISAAKKPFEKNFGVKITLATIVTDDSPQRVWAVEGADLIFTPSPQTSAQLSKFLKDKTKTRVVTVSFPVSPRLAQPLADDEFKLLETQLDPSETSSLHIEIPVSGAAVQLNFLKNLIFNLSDGPFEFTVIGQDSEFSKTFFDYVRKLPRIQVSIGANARQTVDLYESLFYQKKRPAVEITKPSEQAFKAILTPSERGGVILLLTPPIGRQEKDNLNFLIRHDLLPSNEMQRELEDHLLNQELLPDEEMHRWHYRASHWRAIRLPQDPKRAAIFIQRLKKNGVLFAMLSYVSEGRTELTSNGVAQIWQEIDRFLSAA